jgi:hypothetical protein
MTMTLVDSANTTPRQSPLLLQAAEPVPALCIAVGFESDRSWISAQWGELAIRKATRANPLETTVQLHLGPDWVRLDIRGALVVVANGTTALECVSIDAYATVQARLASSAAVSTALALREELLRRGEVQSPESALLSTVEFVHALIAGQRWQRFLDHEATWVEELSAVRPRERAA